MKGGKFKECTQGRRFILKIFQGENLVEKIMDFAQSAKVKYAVLVSAVGSISHVKFRGIKAGARLPITEPRMNVHVIEGPLELLGLEGNLFPNEKGDLDCHLHVLMSKSSGEVLGGHLFEANVFASCEIMLTEFHVDGVERHLSPSAGTSTIFIEETDESE